MQYYLHKVDGAQLSVAPTLTDYTPASDVDDDKTFQISACQLLDQDLIVTNALLADPNGVNTDYVVFYRTAASTWVWAASAMPFPHSATYIQFDSSGTLTTGQQSKWYTSYLLIANKQGVARFIIIPGRPEFASLTDAQNEDLSSFTFDGFDVEECVIAYKMIWETSNSYTSKGKCRMVGDPKALNISTAGVGIGSGTSHNTLSGLQGGTASEYFHFTSAQHTSLSSWATVATSNMAASTTNQDFFIVLLLKGSCTPQ